MASKIWGYEVILNAITHSETLARPGNYDEAEMPVLEASRKQSNASGRDDDLRCTGHRTIGPPMALP